MLGLVLGLHGLTAFDVLFVLLLQQLLLTLCFLFGLLLDTLARVYEYFQLCILEVGHQLLLGLLYGFEL